MEFMSDKKSPFNILDLLDWELSFWIISVSLSRKVRLRIKDCSKYFKQSVASKMVNYSKRVVRYNKIF